MASLLSLALLISIFSSNLTHPSRQTFVLVKTYWRRLQDVFSVTSFCLPIRLANTSWRRLEDVLKTSWRHFRKTYCKYVYKTSSRGLGRRKVSRWRRLEDVLENKKYLLGSYHILTFIIYTNIHLKNVVGNVTISDEKQI